MKRGILISMAALAAAGWFLYSNNAAGGPVEATVNRVIDGDTITVNGTIQGKAYTDKKVRVMFIDTPEVRSNSHGGAMPEGRRATALLRRHLKPGHGVTLVNPGGTIGFDRYGRLLAIVLFNDTSIEELMIRSGYSVLWRKYGSPPEPYLSRWLDAEEEARREKRGCWESSPKWMRDKRNERTAPNY